MIEDYYDFQRVLIFERSVNYRRGTAIMAANWRGCDVAFAGPAP
jgi:hypothetical protein